MDETVTEDETARAKAVKIALIRPLGSSAKVNCWRPDITGALRLRLDYPGLQCEQVQEWIDQIPDCDSPEEAVAKILGLDDVLPLRIMAE